MRQRGSNDAPADEAFGDFLDYILARLKEVEYDKRLLHRSFDVIDHILTRAH